MKWNIRTAGLTSYLKLIKTSLGRMKSILLVLWISTPPRYFRVAYRGLDVGPHPCSARQRGKSVDSRRGSNSREEVHQPIQPALRARRPLAPFMSVRGHEMATKRSRAARTSRNNAPSPSLLLFVAGGRSWMWACSSSD